LWRLPFTGLPSRSVGSHRFAVALYADRLASKIATHMLSFEGDSHVEWFEGNFADYEEDKKRGLGIDSVIPHRLKYKKFSR
jgi:hypothetical protein